MTAVILTLALLAILHATWRTVRADSYGHRPPPRSHTPWSAHGLPSEPYRHSHWR